MERKIGGIAMACRAIEAKFTFPATLSILFEDDGYQFCFGNINI
jgi:hypothetical protein